MKRISVVVITLNEGRNIEDCLRSVSWADEIVVVDSGSKDETCELARKHTENVFHVPFEDFARQKNAAVQKASGDWVFVLDADERVPQALAREIQDLIQAETQSGIYSVGRDTYFFGKRLRFSGTQDDYPARLFPRGRAFFDQPVHEVVRTDLHVQRLKNRLIHYSTRDRNHYALKMNLYIPFEIEIMRQKKRRISPLGPFLRPCLKFFYLYLYRLGILDGFTGLKYAILSAYYDFRKYVSFRKMRTPCRA